MTIGVLFSADTEAAGNRTIELIESLGFTVRRITGESVAKGKDRDALGGSPLRMLLGSDAVVFVLSPGLIRTSLLPFSAGYCLGRRKPAAAVLYAYHSDASRLEIPLPKLRTEAELGQFLEIERQRWLRRRVIREARKAILASGRTLSDESFASCVVEGDLAVAARFIEAGFSPDTCDRKGVPLLALAVRNRHHALVTFLIRQGADVNAVSVDRENTAVMDAASVDDIEILGELLAAGVELDRQNKNGQTALILAIGNGAVESAKQLILSGARTDIKDGLGMTATKYAELFHHTEILRLLESRSGSDRDAGDRGSAEA